MDKTVINSFLTPNSLNYNDSVVFICYADTPPQKHINLSQIGDGEIKMFYKVTSKYFDESTIEIYLLVIIWIIGIAPIVILIYFFWKRNNHIKFVTKL